MKLRIPYLLLFLFAGATIYSCVKKPEYPSQPVIAYKNFLSYGKPLPSMPYSKDSVELVVSFTDNEGDIGLEKADSTGIFKNGNFYMVEFWDSSGIWAPAFPSNTTTRLDTITYYYRVPLVLKEGEKSQPMKGLIYAKIKPWINVFKKIKLDVYMYDEARNKSNRISTPAITFP